MVNKKNNKADKPEDFSDILDGVLVGVQLVDGKKHIGDVVKVNQDYIWLKVRGMKKPMNIPRIIIERTLVLLQGDKE